LHELPSLPIDARWKGVATEKDHATATAVIGHLVPVASARPRRRHLAPGDAIPPPGIAGSAPVRVTVVASEEDGLGAASTVVGQGEVKACGRTGCCHLGPGRSVPLPSITQTRTEFTTKEHGFVAGAVVRHGVTFASARPVRGHERPGCAVPLPRV